MMIKKVVHSEKYSFYQFDDQVKIVKNGSFDLVGWLPFHLVEGKTVNQLISMVGRNNSFRRLIELRVENLKKEYPEISLGYIGNITPTYNDTHWSVFLPGNKSVGDFHFWDFESFYDKWYSVIVPNIKKILKRVDKAA